MAPNFLTVFVTLSVVLQGWTRGKGKLKRKPKRQELWCYWQNYKSCRPDAYRKKTVLTLRRLIFARLSFTWINFQGFHGFLVNLSFVSSKCLIPLSATINPREIILEIFYSTVPVSERVILLFSTLNFEYGVLYRFSTFSVIL